MSGHLGSGNRSSKRGAANGGHGRSSGKRRRTAGPVLPSSSGTNPPVIVMHPSDVCVYSGPRAQAVFVCQAEVGPAVTYKWVQGGRVLKDGVLKDGRDKIRGASTKTLVIANLRSDSSKRRTVGLLRSEPVQCIVTGAGGVSRSRGAKFEVKLSPREAANILRRDYGVANKLAPRLGVTPPKRLTLPHLSSSKPSAKDMALVETARDVLDEWTLTQTAAIEGYLRGDQAEKQPGHAGGAAPAEVPTLVVVSADPAGVRPRPPRRWDDASKPDPPMAPVGSPLQRAKPMGPPGTRAPLQRWGHQTELGTAAPPGLLAAPTFIGSVKYPTGWPTTLGTNQQPE